MFPGMFSWVKYPELLDKNLVRLALTDARRMNTWVLGTHKAGWVLTDTGRDVGMAVLDSDQKSLTAKSSDGASKAPNMQLRNRLLSSEVHAKVRTGLTDFNRDEIYSFFRINPYMSNPDISRRINRIKQEFAADSELSESVAVAIEALKSMIGDDVA